MLPIWKLMGFVLYLILYFSVLQPYDKWPQPSAGFCFFKVLPIMHLVLIIISTSTEEENHMKPASYRLNIMFGLLLSAAGNVALVYADDYFKVGVLLFSVAQFFYVLAFGVRPFGSGPMASSFLVVGTALYLYVIDSMKEGIEMKVLVLFYTLLIVTMAWRAAVQFAQNKNIENLCALVGALMFVVSDTILAVDKWKGSFAYAPFWNMATYYFAQLGIALSACNTHQAKFRSYVVTKED